MLLGISRTMDACLHVEEDHYKDGFDQGKEYVEIHHHCVVLLSHCSIIFLQTGKSIRKR